MAQDIAAVISALAQFGWLAIVAILLVRHRDSISNLIDRLSKFRIKLPNGTEVEVTAAEAASIAQQLLAEADQLIEDIDAEDQELLAKHEPQTVVELINGFQREDTTGQPTKDLMRLRKLRDRQLIRPMEGGQFYPNKLVVIKPFGRILLRLRGEKLLGVGRSA